jgi:hypothetical protein
MTQRNELTDVSTASTLSDVSGINLDDKSSATAVVLPKVSKNRCGNICDVSSCPGPVQDFVRCPCIVGNCAMYCGKGALRCLIVPNK